MRKPRPRHVPMAAFGDSRPHFVAIRLRGRGHRQRLAPIDTVTAKETAMSHPHIARRPSWTSLATLAIALVATAAIVTSPPTQAAGTATYETAFAQFQVVLHGQPDGAEEAAVRWREVSAAQPTDPVPRAYVGASTALMARSTLLPWRKMTYTEDGLALIDKALAMLTPAHDAPGHRGVPSSLETRFVAATTFLGLPAMFNRQERGAALMKDLANSPLLATSPAEFRATVWLAAGDAAAKDKRVDEARQWFQKAATSGTSQAAAAQARLGAL